jgi:hypothetical protein
VQVTSQVNSTVFISDIKLRLSEGITVPISVTNMLSSNNLINAIIDGLVKLELTDDEKKLSDVNNVLSYIQIEKQKKFGNILATSIFETINKKKPITKDIPIRPVTFINEEETS